MKATGWKYSNRVVIIRVSEVEKFLLISAWFEITHRLLEVVSASAVEAAGTWEQGHIVSASAV